MGSPPKCRLSKSSKDKEFPPELPINIDSAQIFLSTL